MPDPWSYAKPTSEHSHQAALFMWANMAEKFGLAIADDPLSYTKAGHALARAHAPRTSDIDQRLYMLVPQLKWLHAIHNQGHGDKIRGAKAKAEGVKAGVSDIFLPVPVTFQRLAGADIEHCGLYIELKPPTQGKTSPEQVEFQSDMTMLGYKCVVARGWLEARKEICIYLGLPVDS